MTKPTSLYRFFDAHGVLLYVGITSQGAQRWNQHSNDKPWWPEVATTTVEHYPTRPAALEAERLAIQSEGPRYNVVHNVTVWQESKKKRLKRRPEPKASLLQCEACGGWVGRGDGYLEVSPIEIKQYQRCATDDPAKWRAWHRQCDPHPSASTYWISSDRLCSDYDVEDWDDHLSGKSWIGATDWPAVKALLMRLARRQAA